MTAKPGKLWGNQYPFERNHLQRAMALLGLGGVFAVTVIILVHTTITGVLGIFLICAGVVAAFAAASRHRYVRETEAGFAILRARGGLFVLSTALAFAVVGVLVAVLVLLG
ncbi:hypothetical protein [Mycolicibacterium palauense]|uniref:hypothetical protein n=1 Tax=Mycolicibacterium palauense TaxID=2034511 RepID=UPI000BFEB583|nr:hypothetical protein [Mycolicibacterium palauense]